MAESPTDLGHLLDLAPTGTDCWQGQTEDAGLPQLFGGQLISQSVVAAGRSVATDKQVRSIHAHFLAAGARDVPVDYEVARVRDGRLLSVREVTATQEGRVLCRSTVSCSVELDGIEHHARMPGVGPPLTGRALEDIAESDTGLGVFWDGFTTFDLRVARLSTDTDASEPATTAIWMRAARDLPDDPLVHAGALAYASDLMLMETTLEPHGHRRGQARTLDQDWSTVSLDHALWFQAPTRVDEWMLFELSSPSAFGGRALVRSQVFDLDGHSVAQVSQEALVRRLDRS